MAFIIVENDRLSPSERLQKEVFATWPYIVITTLLAVLAGIIMSLLVSKITWPCDAKSTYALK